MAIERPKVSGGLPMPEQRLQDDVRRLFDGQSAVKDILSSLREDIARLSVLITTVSDAVKDNRLKIDHMECETDQVRDRRSTMCAARIDNCSRTFKALTDWQTAMVAEEQQREKRRAAARIHTSLWIGGLYTLATIALVIIAWVALSK